jgi:PAS domain S-box-containing protein
MPVSFVAATLTRLLTLVFLPLGLFATAILYWSAHQEQLRAESGLVATTRALALAVDRQLAIHGAALSALAESEALRRGDLAAFHEFARQVGQQYGTWVVMLDSTGQQLINTRLPPGTPLPRTASLDRVTRVFSTGRPVVSDLFFGTVAQHFIISVDIPVVREGRVAYVLDMPVSPEALTRLLQRHSLPAEWVAGIVDSQGLTVAWTANGDSRIGRPASSRLMQAFSAKPEGIIEEADGVPQRVAFARLPDAPLSVVLAAPASAIAAWHRGPLAVFVLGGTALFAALVYLAGWHASRLTRMLSSMVLTDEALRAGPIRTSPAERLRRPLETYGVAASSVALVVLMRLLLDPILGDRFVLLPFFPAVAVAVWFGGVGPGLFAIVAGYVAANYLFLEPRYAFTVGSPVESIGLWLFVAGNLIILALGERARRSEAAERERAAQAEGGQALLRTLLEHGPIGITIAGGAPGFPIIANSKTAAELTGRQAEQLLGMPVGAHEKAFGFHLPDGTQLPPEATPLYRACRGESVLDQEGLVVRPDGSRIAVSMAAVPIRDTAGGIVGAIKCWYDITERKAAEEALREADARKDAFLATLAHELRNPLAAIRNALMFLDQPGIPETTARRGRDIALRQVGQLTRLVDDLLDVSRITFGKIDLVLAPELLADIVEEAAESCRPHVDKAGHELTIELPAEPVWVAADRTRLVQVLTNLLVNSAKYTPPGGHVTLVCTADEAEATVSVRDDGVGISAEFLPHVFEAFRQGVADANDIQGGLGVGLSLVKQLVELHGGTVAASSPGPGRGSTFTVRLPRIRAPSGAGVAAEKGSKQASGLAGHGHSRRVLVVDDNVDAAESTSILLRLHGHAVRHVSDGIQALDAARAFRPDVMVVDLGMPGMSGYEVARRVRALPELADVLLIALTGWGQETHRNQTAEAGFDHHLVKPVDPELLNELVISPNGRKAEDAA